MTWPIGQEAVVQFSAHDSHKKDTDVYRPSFVQLPSRCTQMVAVVITSPSGLQVAFCGRKPPGTYNLEYVVKGFPGAHGSLHLYNMLGGKVYEVDYIFAQDIKKSKDVNEDYLEVKVPGEDLSQGTTFLVPREIKKSLHKHLIAFLGIICHGAYIVGCATFSERTRNQPWTSSDPNLPLCSSEP